MAIAAIIGAAAAIGGTIYGAVQQGKQAKKMKNELNQEEAENEAWYNRRYNEVGTERADAQRALTAMREAQKARMQRSAGAQAVAGASQESSAAEKAAANKAIGDTVSAINAQQEARKDKIEDQYMAEKRNIRKQRVGLAENTQAQTAAATSQVLNVAGNAIASGAFNSKSGNSAATGASTQQQTVTPQQAENVNNAVNRSIRSFGANNVNQDDLSSMYFNSKWGW